MTRNRESPRVLILSVGNRLRGDDGLAHEAARLLADKGLPEGTVLREECQWTPEMARELSQVDFAILLDASSDLPPGRIETHWLETCPDAARDWAATFTHTWDPRALVAAAMRWYGRSPKTLLIVGGGQNFGLIEDQLTAAAVRAAQAMAEKALGQLTLLDCFVKAK